MAELCPWSSYQKVYFRNIREDTGIRPTTRRKLDSEYDGAARGSKAAEKLNLEKLHQARQQQDPAVEEDKTDEKWVLNSGQTYHF